MACPSLRSLIASASTVLWIGGCTSDPSLAVGSDAGPGAEDGATAGAPRNYRANVRWTRFGIPHFKAEDMPSVAYAMGYVESRDTVCILADQFVRIRSERAKTFGPGDDDANIESDFAFLGAGVFDTAEATFDQLDAETREIIVAFAAGYNRFVDENAPDGLPAPCTGADWVQPITPLDLWAYYYWLGLFGSVDPLLNFIGGAAPPVASAALETAGSNASGPAAAASAARLRSAGRLGVDPGQIGSNGWAIGKELSETGRGMLVVNPHFPWQGPRRFYEHHIIVEGRINAYGVGLTGVPLVNIGFNENVAWTHTVTTANHFTIYRLELVPGNPTAYRYDDEEREMTARDLSIGVLEPDGSTRVESRTLYRSHYGPMISIPGGLDWTETTAYTFRDANDHNLDLARTWLGMDRAKDLSEFEAVQEEAHGIPWVNTMSVSADGTALFFDASRTPRLSEEAEAVYREALETDLVTRVARDSGAVLLDGSDSAFEWEDGDSRVPGIVAYSDSPRLERTDFVANANDSHWLTNPAAPLTGFSKLFGDEATERSPRTRMNLMMLTESGADSLMGEDGKFSFDELSAVHFDNRAAMAELLRAELVSRCEASSQVDVDGAAVDLTESCAVLAKWDGRLDLASAGAPLFREFLAAFAALADAGDLFQVPFDPADPVATPNTLAEAPAAGPDPVLVALANASGVLEQAGFELAVTLGELQYTMRGDDRIPIHGGTNDEGAFNIVDYAASDGTLLAGLTRGATLSASGLATDGYPVNRGSSSIMVIHFAEEGPEARALLTYSQSNDPASDYFADQTLLFSEKNWRPVSFREEDIDSDPDLVEEDIVGTSD